MCKRLAALLLIAAPAMAQGAAAPTSALHLPPFHFGKILSEADPAEHHPGIERRYTAAFKACLADPNLNMIDQQQCDQAEMARQDKALNAAWRVILARLDKGMAGPLRRAERAWIKGREAHCQLAAKEAEGGSLSAVLYGQCMIDEAIRRTIWLEGLR